ncbi:hypothetical protein, partial [Methylobacterium sp. WL93]|uniref:hypothetical protein n=1 Tax=Methylobacterium sp. WL93 TaxID=2603892 RepID=UPI00164EE1AC
LHRRASRRLILPERKGAPARLSRAAALGIPTTAFFATLDEGDRIAESLTLLRLWATLDQPGQRRELLDHLRRMIDGPPPG